MQSKDIFSLRVFKRDKAMAHIVSSIQIKYDLILHNKLAKHKTCWCPKIFPLQLDNEFQIILSFCLVNILVISFKFYFHLIKYQIKVLSSIIIYLYNIIREVSFICISIMSILTALYYTDTMNSEMNQII